MRWKGGLGHDRARYGGWVVCIGKIYIFIAKRVKARIRYGLVTKTVLICVLMHLMH